MAKQASTTLSKAEISEASSSSLKWYAVFTDFFQSVNLYETIRGFEADLLVLSRAQHEKLSAALERLGEEVFRLCLND